MLKSTLKPKEPPKRDRFLTFLLFQTHSKRHFQAYFLGFQRPEAVFLLSYSFLAKQAGRNRNHNR